MATPPREHDEDDDRAKYDLSPDESEEVDDTLKSAHQAEVELGYHFNGRGTATSPSDYNGTSKFHNQRGYFARGFDG